MNILVVTGGYSIFDAKGQLNGFLAHLTEKNLISKGHKVKFSDTTKDTYDVNREVDKLLWAESIIYITPIMWFNMPAPMVEWLDKVLLYEKTFVITEEYGEGGQLSAESFMVVATSNMKSSDLGKGFVMKDTPHIDGVLQPLIMTNNYLNVRKQIPTFHAGDVIASDTSWIEEAYVKHLDKYYSTSLK